MKKRLRHIAIAVCVTLAVVCALPLAVYIPAVQNWLVEKATAIASEETGLDISVKHIDLRFPLDLGIDDVLVVRPQRDTIAIIGRVVVDVRLLPLLKGRVVVNGLELQRACVNTYDLISDVQVSGCLGLLKVASKGINLNNGTAELNGALLKDADVTILLSDTAAVDTTKTETPWLISLDQLDIRNSRVALHLPGDSMLIDTYMGHTKVTDGSFDLENGIYTVRSFDWNDGTLNYDLPLEPRKTEGIDYSHLALSGISIGIDSLYYSSNGLSLRLRHTALKEQSGLELNELCGTLLLDSASIRLPNMTLVTPYSNIRAKLSADFSVMDSIQPGQLHADLQASIGKPDISLFLADMPQDFRRKWPEWPLQIDAKVDGNMQQAHIDRMELTLPTAFRLSAKGDISGTATPADLLAELDMQAETYNLDFALPLLNEFTGSSLRIPSGMKLDGQVKATGQHYTAQLNLRQGQGTATCKGWYNQKSQSYDATLSIRDLNLHAFLPQDSLYSLTADVKASGHGTDPMNSRTKLQAEADIRHLRYGQHTIDSVKATVRLDEGRLQADLNSCNALMEGLVSVGANINRESIEGTAFLDLQKLDLYKLMVVEKPLVVGGSGKIDIGSDLQDDHWVRVFLNELSLRTKKKTYRPEDFGLFLHTRPDSTWARIQSGNLIVKADASGGYKQLIQQLTQLADTIASQYQHNIIDQEGIKRQLPNARLYVTSGRENPIAAMLRAGADIDFKELMIDLTTSPTKGVNALSYVHSLNADSIRIDTLHVTLKDTDHGLTFQGRIENNRRNPQFVFKALFDGLLQEHGASFGVRYFDDKGVMGLRLGAKADMMEEGIRLHLLPERPTIGYKIFTLNADNYLLLRHNTRVETKIDLIADDGTGVKIYSEDQDSTLMQDLTMSLHRVDLGQLTSVIPYMPRISGMLNGDYHFVMDHQKRISVASDMQIADFVYEQNPIGQFETEIVYLQRENNTHAVEAIFNIDSQEVAALRGEYQDEGGGKLDADLKLDQMPLSIINGFVPDQLVGLEGKTDGELTVKGSLARPQVDGELYLTSSYLISKPYGIRLRFDDDPVRVVNSQLLLDNFTMYEGKNDQPLNFKGNIDFHDTDNITMDVRVVGRNFQIINSKQTKESIAYGKAFVNLFARINGALNDLTVRGRLDVLGTTDLTYLLLDSPLSTSNQMDELVRFTDFTDSTQTVVQKPAPQGLDVDLSISIDPGVHILCGLNAEQNNYVDLFGGGDLHMKYGNDGINMTGRYTLSSGEMKYSLPIIPLKTFTIQDGSYVEFTGDISNPRLNLTAIERTKASVSSDGQQSRSVTFDCGVVISKTLKDMGLQFIISAPEDMSITSELNAMGDDQRGKLAVTMLTTGMYLADGNTGSFSMNSALSSFLQSEINNITGNALKTLDLSIGLDNTTDATGATHTDYSFKFAKRFWNNRLKVQIGGKVSTGAEVEGQKQSFFDNVVMEYRISPVLNQYVKLFYSQNVYDWLEGYTSEYGGGYVWKRKLDKFSDIFKIWGNKQKLNTPTTRTRTPVPTDSVKANQHEEKK